MIGGQTNEPFAAEAVGARIADMNDVCNAATHDQACEGASHAREFRVVSPLRVDPAIERVHDLCCGALYLHGLRKIAEAIKEAAHCHFCRDAATFRSADAIGD